jgi:glucose-6-phosphate isomerase
MINDLIAQHFKNVSDLKISTKTLSACKKSSDKLRQEIKSSAIAAIDVIFAEEDLKNFSAVTKKLSSFKKIVVIGVGGSSLGGKTISALKFQDRVEFLESIDPITLNNFLQKITLEETFFLVVSKSGETIETSCQTLILLDLFKKKKIKNFAKQFLFITESKTNSLAKIAQEIGSEILPHCSKIGGRYSCFSITGMLPALLAGIDVKKIRNGAKRAVESFLKNDTTTKSCALQLELYEAGFVNNVMMPYIDNLKNFNDWYRQLWAESLGKNNFGSTPINSMGTVDQHSQLQLYLDGPRNKFFTFVSAKEHGADFKIKDLKSCPTLFGGKNLSDVVKIEEETTIEVLNQKKLPIRLIKIHKLDEEVLGALMMQMILETIVISYSKSINPFDQPAVELRKNLAKKCLKSKVKK